MPSDSKNVRLTVLVSPLITFAIVFPNFANSSSYRPEPGDVEALGEVEVEGLSEADLEDDGE